MKKTELPKWKDKKLIEKVLHILCLLVAGIIILLEFLKQFSIYNGENIFELLLGILLLMLAIEYYKYDKKIFLFNLITGLIILICGIIILVI